MSGNSLKCLSGFVIGAAAGSVVAALIIPENGKKVREEIRKRIEAIKRAYDIGYESKFKELEADIRRRCGEA